MGDETEVDRIRRAIETLEAQRDVLSDAVVDTALAPLRERLAALEVGAGYETRRLVTIVFADLVGSTELSAQLDAEDMRELLNVYFARCRAAIELHGGVVEKFIGDAVMAVFGLRAAEEDDPERAIGAALEIAAMPRHLAAERPLTPSFSTRVGVNTGEVVVGALGERLEDEFVVVGDAVNLASRVESAAPPGGVLITDDTYRHVRGLFDVEAVEPLALKGIEKPVVAYLVKRAAPRPFRTPWRGVEGIKTTVVGREAEFAQLAGAFRATVHDREVRVVTITGDAGIGKSRLMAELEDWFGRRPEEALIFKGRAHPSMQTAPHALIRDVLARRFEIDESDAVDVVRRKLESGYREALPDAAPDAALVLGRLLGFDVGPLAGLEEDPRALHDRAMALLRDYFTALARRHPVVVLLEDVHWADDTSLDVVERLKESMDRLPVLVVATARPMLYQRRSAWGADDARVSRLDLDVLTREDSAALVEQILRNVDDLPRSLVDLIVDAADGNPFYIEELVKMLIEDGLIHTDGKRWTVEPDRIPQLHVPPTLTGVLQARLDRLAASERMYLQRGAVIGRVFWDTAVAFLAEHPVHDVEHRLRSREMVFERDHSTFEGAHEYVFKHALVRDVAYESVLRRQRRELHARAARWLEQVCGKSGRADQFATVIAAHHEAADERAIAAEWYARAGTSAAARYANSEALHAFDRALDLLPAEDLRQELRIRMAREQLYELQGATDERRDEIDRLRALADALGEPLSRAAVDLRDAAFALGIADFEAVLERAEHAAQLAVLAGDLAVAAEAALLEAQALTRQGAFDAARERAHRGLTIAKEHNLARVEALSQRQLGLIAYHAGAQRDARDHFAAALDLFTSIGDRQGETAAINNLGGVAFEMGDHAGAGRYYQRSLDLAREIGDRMGEGRALNNLGIVAVVGGAYERAEEHYLDALRISRDIGQRSFEMAALDNLGNVALCRYQFDRAKRFQLAALEGSRELGDRLTEAYVLTNLARARLMISDLEAAAEYIAAGLELMQQLADDKGECELLMCTGELHMVRGAIDEARSHAERAHRLTCDRGLREEEAEALHLLGDIAMVSGTDSDVAEAVERYVAALDLRLRLEEPASICDTRAALAAALVASGRMADAVEHVEAILAAWADRGMGGLAAPGAAVLACYRVLTATGDGRAADVLERGHALLLEAANTIEDPAARRAYLQDIPAHRELIRLAASAT